MFPMKTDSSLMLKEYKFVQIIYLKVPVLPEWVLIVQTESGSMYSLPDSVDQHLLRPNQSSQVKSLNDFVCPSHQERTSFRWIHISKSHNPGKPFDTSIQQTVGFRCRFNKRFVFGGASTNGSFSEAPQQTGKVIFWRFKLISDFK